MFLKYLPIILTLIFALIQNCKSKSLNKSLDLNCNDLSCNIDKNVKDTLCNTCQLIIPYARELVLKNQTDQVINLAAFLCSTLRIEDKNVCNQILNFYSNSLISIAIDSPLTNNELCSIFLSCGPVNNTAFNWNVTLPNVPKPPIYPPKLPKEGSPIKRILHLTDIHIDFEYQPGALAECDQPLCCRNSSTSKLEQATKNKTAGFWGDYRNCDVPLWTVENMFEHISNNEQFDFIYWTGDLPSHNVWNQSKSDQLNALDVLTDLFKKYFPNKIIYPALGNHESTPSNLFPTPYTKQDNISWLYHKLAEDWTQTGLPKELKNNITNGAFYTMLLYPGVRLISLNMNYCYNLNFWLYINSTDPLDQLKWLGDILQESENNNQKVHIIGHVDPATCLSSWSFNYYRIVNRYESTIVGQFFGHKHNDYFEMFYDLENITRPIGVAYLAGSTTTYSYLNPSYRIYTVDGFYKNTTWQVLDHETNILNITEANLSNMPKWKREYSAKSSFNMTSLFPSDWNNLLNKSIKNLNGIEAQKLLIYYTNSNDTPKRCDTKCKRNILCKFKQSRPDNRIPC